MAHPIWKGAISFGLVNIPVGLFSAQAGEARLEFSLLDSRDLSPIGYRKVSKRTGREVPAAETVRGYELEDKSFVVLDDEDFRRANAKATQTVEILDFVDINAIHPVFFEKPYFLAPVGRGAKGYALFRAALRGTGKAAVAKVVVHSREYVGVVLPYKGALVLDLLRYSGELRQTGDLDLPDEDLEKLGVSDREVEMAERLIGSMTADWDPGRYHDSYREELLGYIKKKALSGEAVEAAEAMEEAPGPGAEVIDLMALLKKSVEETRRSKARKKASGQ